MDEAVPVQVQEAKVTNLLSALKDSLNVLSSPPSNSNTNAHDQEIISRLKFGSATVDAFTCLLDKIPNIWPHEVCLSLITGDWSGKESVDALLKWILPWYEPRCLPSEHSLYLGPPTGVCFSCSKDLHQHNRPTNVKYASSAGLISQKRKITLRCRSCGINYRFDMFGSRKDGYRFYDVPRDAVVAVDTVFVDKKVFSLQSSFSLHSWVSSEGFAESWHEAYQHTKEEVIDRRTWQKAFWWGELEDELHRLKSTHQISDVGYRFYKKSEDMDRCMEFIDSLRKQMSYKHLEQDCSTDCRARGCGKLWATDGLWKIRFAHCMFYVKNEVENVELVNYPSVCANQPMPGKALCSFHCEYVQKTMPEIPLTLREFLKYEGIDESEDSDIDVADNEEMPITTGFGKQGASESDGSPVDSGDTEDYDGASSSGNSGLSHMATSPLTEQTGQVFLQQNVSCVQEILTASEQEQSRCNKDLGQRSTLRRMSRGIQVIVRAGGHIDMWTPLYVSESNGQVFLFIISWLYETLQNIPSMDWHKVILSYDNMCQLIKMRASKELLNLPKPYDEMWKKITKVIDTLHISNHVMDMCKTELHPDIIGKIHPELTDSKNTQSAEQTFVYLGRHWRVTNSMTKYHQLFYLHRLCIRRNAYVSKCNRLGKRPLLPSRKKATSNKSDF